MTEEKIYANKQIIYAKIDAYPWWPGKIVKNLKQEHKTVYKVHFFCDPTYCYLRADSIIPYQAFNTLLNQQYSFDFKLQKAISVANKAYAKKPSHCSQQVASLSPLESSLLDDASSNLKMEVQLSNNMGGEQKTEFYEFQQTNNESQLDHLFSTTITYNNVIPLLNQNPISRLKQSNCSRIRQSVTFRQRLKLTLLSKYKLDFNFTNKPFSRELFDNSSQNEEKYQNRQRKLKYKYKQKIIKKRTTLKYNERVRVHERQNNPKSVKSLCQRRIYSVLASQQIECSFLKQKTIEIVKKIQNASEGNDELFRKIYVAVLRWIVMKRDGNNITIDEICDIETILITNLINQQKKQDDQKSKLTQISQRGSESFPIFQ